MFCIFPLRMSVIKHAKLCKLCSLWEYTAVEENMWDEKIYIRDLKM